MILLLCGFFFGINAKAAVIISNQISTAHTQNSSAFQSFSFPATTTVYYIELEFSNNKAACTSYNHSWTLDNGYTTYTIGPIDLIPLINASGLPKIVGLSIPSGFQFAGNNATTTLTGSFISSTGDCTGNPVQIYGSATNSYNGGYSNSTGLADWYFTLYDSNVGTNTSFIQNISPTMGSTTASTQVMLSFDYNAISTDQIDQYQFQIQDWTPSGASSSPMTINSPPIILSGPASSGSHSISQVVTLIQHHTYGLDVYLCSSITGQCFNTPGAATQFYVVDDLYNQAVIANQQTSTSSPNFILQNWFSWNQKFPFSWVLPIYNILNTLGQTATSSAPGYTLDLSIADPATSTPMKGILPSFTFLSKDTMSKYIPDSLHTFFFTLQAASYWLGLAFLMWRQTPKVFAKL